MGILIAGERSGVGKTTITLAILSALVRQGFSVQSYKVGPDYIDPMFHQWVTGRPCRNLDPVLTSETYVQACFWQHAQAVEAVLVEGVMGLFDGADGEDWASSAHIARLLNLPILLVLDCSRLSRSVAALVHGYQTFDPRLQFAGVILNRVGSDRHLELLQTALNPSGLPILGAFRRDDRLTIPDRHLGLVPANELEQLNDVVDQLACLGQQAIDWATLLPLLTKSISLSIQPPIPVIAERQHRPQIAVARDSAFSFYYADNLELLEQLGAELMYWSPLQDTQLPPGTQALYFGGGFPEVFAEALSLNQAACKAVRDAIAGGTPTYAECGGLMYLCQKITDFEGRNWSMAGVLPTTAVMDQRLTLGYRKAIAIQNTPLLQAGQQISGHEFHRSCLTTQPDRPIYQIQSPRYRDHTEGWAVHQLHASYLHLHWGSQPEIAQRFLQVAAQTWNSSH